MKIAVISSSVFSLGPGGLVGYGGLEQIAWLCAKGLAELGHEVSLIAPQGSTCPGVTVIETGPPGKWDEKSCYKSYWQHLPQFDCIISHDWQKWAYKLKEEGKLKAPVLGVLHTVITGQMQSLPPVENPCFVAISHDQANHFEALFNRRPQVCHNGIDLSFYKTLGIPRTDRYLFLARFSSIKAPHTNIELCLQAGVGLDMIGDTSITNEPDYFRHCQFLAEQTSPGWDRSKGKQIRLIGSATRGECVRWFSQARALLHVCPQWREPFGLSACEAQAINCPVLAFDMGACRETIQHTKTGFVVKSFNEALDVLKNNKLDDLNRDYCREWVSQFSVENMCKRYEELCELAVKEGGW